MAVTQELSDLGQRCAGPQHHCRRGVAQSMSMDKAKATPPGNALYHPRYGTGSESTMRRCDPYEYRPTMRGRRATLAQIRRYRFADVSR
jgi:hypothetical protein